MTSSPAIPSLLFVPGDSQTDYAALYAIATTYAHSGLLISKHGDTAECPTFALPAIVCSSFAIELFLKFFLMLKRVRGNDPNSKRERGHFLRELWKDVSPEHRALIAGMHRNKSGEPHLNASDMRIEIFVKALDEVGKAPFLQWRYAHEFEEITFMSHVAVADVVDALGRAAEYVMKKERSAAISNEPEARQGMVSVEDQQSSARRDEDIQQIEQSDDDPLAVGGSESSLLDHDSVLKRIPSNLDPTAALFLDGIRYAVEFMDVTFERLRNSLTDLASNPPESNELSRIIAHVFLDAWGFIEAVDRFHALYTHFPGMKRDESKTLVPSLGDATLEFRNLCKFARDLPGNAESLVSQSGAVLGELSWLTIAKLEPEVVAWHCLLHRGTLLTAPQIGSDPAIGILEWPTFAIKLSAGGHEANLSEVRKHIGLRVKHLEAQLPSVFDQQTQAGVPVMNEFFARRPVKLVLPVQK